MDINISINLGAVGKRSGLLDKTLDEINEEKPVIVPKKKKKKKKSLLAKAIESAIPDKTKYTAEVI